MDKNKLFLVVDEDGDEYLCKCTLTPIRDGGNEGDGFWNGNPDEDDDVVDFKKLPSGTIKMLIGKELTWKDEPLEISVNII